MPETQRTLADMVAAFLRDRRASNLTRNTITFYADKLKTFREFCERLSVEHVEAVTAEVLRDFMLGLEARHNAGGRHAYYRSVRAFLRWYESEYEPDGWAPPTRKVRAPSLPTEPLDPVGLDVVDRLLSTCRDTWYGVRDRAILITLIDTGLRASELTALDVADYDRPTSGLEIRQGKGRKPRLVFLGQNGKRAMRKWLKRRPESAPGPLFLNRYKGRLEYDGLREIIQQRAALACVDPPPLHAFRRGFAINFLRNGGDAFTLQRLLGHTDMSQTRIYVNQTADDLQAVHQRASPGDRVG